MSIIFQWYNNIYIIFHILIHFQLVIGDEYRTNTPFPPHPRILTLHYIVFIPH